MIWGAIEDFLLSMLGEKAAEWIKDRIIHNSDNKKASKQMTDSIKAQLKLQNEELLSNQGLINYIKNDFKTDAYLYYSSRTTEQKNEALTAMFNKACHRAGIAQGDDAEAVIKKIISLCIEKITDYYIKQLPIKDLVHAELIAMKAAMQDEMKRQAEQAKLRSEMNNMIDTAWKREHDDCPSMNTFPKELGYEVKCLIHIEESQSEKAKNIPLEEAIRQTWGRHDRFYHISLYGVGGLGKTISLLKLSNFIRKIYIPLRSLARKGSIEDYIIKHVFGRREDLYKEFFQLCHADTEDKPNYLLILDGLNELEANDHKKDILKEIEDYSKCRSLQILISSRYDVLPECKSCSGKMLRFRMCMLTRDQITHYLKASKIKMPDPDSRIWDVIDTPLMLNLYSSVEKYKNEFYDLNSILLYDSTSAGTIIWNYLQSELARYKTDQNITVEPLVALEYIAPYIAYRMQQSKKFIWNCRTLKENIQKAIIQFYNEKDRLPSHIARVIDNSSESIEGLNKDSINRMLTDDMCLFIKSGDNVQFMHQHFRDALAALYLYQTADAIETNSKIPDIWIKMPEKEDQYVFSFLCDFFHTDSSHSIWKKLWMLMRRDAIQHDVKPNSLFAQMMLKLYTQSYDNNLKDIDFSGLDISEIPLLNYRLNECSANHFDGTTIGQKTVKGDGHSMKICSVSWSNDGKRFLSASYDTLLRIWSNNEYNDINVTGVNPHGHYIRCAQWNPSDQSMIASAGDDKKVIIWHEKSDRWEPKCIGETEDWIYAICWDKSGRQIVCSGRSGNVYSFSVSDEEFRYGKHPTEVKCVACSEGRLFATGDMNGIVYIWEFQKGGPIITLKFCKKIIEIQWIGQNIIVVFTAEGFWFIDCNELIKHEITQWKQTDADGLICKETCEGISAATINYIKNICYIAAFNEFGLTAYKGLYDEKGIFYLATIDKVMLNSKETGIVSCASWNTECDKLLFGTSKCSILEAELYHEEATFDRFMIKKISDGNPKSARCSAWNMEGTLLAVGYDDGYIRIWNLNDNRCEKTLKGHIDSVKCLSWEPKQKSERLVSGSDDGYVIIWDSTKDDKGVTLGNNLSQVNCILWDEDQKIICGTDNNGLYVWDLKEETKKPIVHSVNTRIYSVIKIPGKNNTYISAGNDMKLYLWNIDTEKKELVLIQQINSEHTEPIRGLTWIPEKNGVISVSNDSTILFRRYDIETGRLINEKEELEHHHNDYIYNVTTSKNGKYIVTGSTDATLGIWNVHDFAFIKQLRDHETFIWNVSPGINKDSICYVASSSSDGTTRIWDVTVIDPLKEIHSVFCFDVLPGMELAGCDLSKAKIDQDIIKIIALNGGIVT